MSSRDPGASRNPVAICSSASHAANDRDLCSARFRKAGLAVSPAATLEWIYSPVREGLDHASVKHRTCGEFLSPFSFSSPKKPAARRAERRFLTRRWFQCQDSANACVAFSGPPEWARPASKSGCPDRFILIDSSRSTHPTSLPEERGSVQQRGFTFVSVSIVSRLPEYDR